MPRPTFSIVLLLGLCSGVALAHATAAPRAPKPSRGKATPTCVRGTPSKEQCLVAGYLDACKKHRKACEPHVENGFREFYDDPKYGHAAAPTAKMLRPTGDSIPKDLREGKLFAYEPPKGKPKRRSESLTGRTGLTGPPASVPASEAKNAHRRPPWENNGAKVKSCNEYAYEGTYDWSRFTDATAACRGDWRCQMDIALMPSTPGIANRTLVRKDGEPIRTQPGGAKSGPIPKNDMFVLGTTAELLVLAGPPKKDMIGGPGAPKTPERAALIKLLEDGVDHYALGCGRGRCKGDKQFANAWDMHRQLYERNKTVSLAEFEEYDRRKREFNRLLDEWGAVVEKELEQATRHAKIPQTEHFQMPFEWVVDPYERLGILDTQQALIKKNLSKLNANAAKQKQGALGLPTTTPVALFAAPRATRPAPTPGPSKPSKGKKGIVEDYDTIDACESWRTNSTGREFMGYGPYSCRVGRFLRQEYARMSLGQKSCLDPNDDDCDWSPSEFQRRFVEGLPYLEEQRAYLDECKAWMPAKIDNLPMKEVENSIEAVQAAAGQAWKELGPVSNKVGGAPDGKVESLGKVYEDSDVWGDKDFLAVGYDANVGWNIAPAQHAGSEVCALAGAADAAFSANAWMLGGKKSMVSADVAASVNEGNLGKLSVKGNLRVLGESVYDGGASSGALVYDSGEAGEWGMQFPQSKPTWNVMAGPVPVTGSVWGEILYGARFEVRAKAKKNQCNKDAITFGIDTTSTPGFMISALGQVGVGIGGVASVGVRGMINLITFAFPIDADIGIEMMPVPRDEVLRPHLVFDAGMGLLLGTLSGKLMLYIEVLLVESTFELFKWNGLRTEMPLMDPLTTKLPLVGWKK